MRTDHYKSCDFNMNFKKKKNSFLNHMTWSWSGQHVKLQHQLLTTTFNDERQPISHTNTYYAYKWRWQMVTVTGGLYPLSTTTMSNSNPYKPREKYTCFCMLVIGRANAGKMTLLQCVCNTTEDPCIFDNDKNVVSVHRLEYGFYFWPFQLAWTYFGGTPLTIVIL